jgi:hypothetical protein
MQQDQLFAALFENYVKNLQMSSMQQENASIGRLGISPIAPKLQAGSGQMAPSEG